jgi:pectinesterase
MNCELGGHIRPEGWHNWGKKSNEETTRYLEYNNRGEGAATAQRVAWSRQLSKKEALQITKEKVFARSDAWAPAE